jgi:hypothetical protein
MFTATRGRQPGVHAELPADPAPHSRRLAPLPLTDQDIDCFLELMDGPEFSCNFYPLVSARGRRAPR